MTPAQLSALPDEPLSPRESMLKARFDVERACVLDLFAALGDAQRRGDRYRLALWLSWALVGVMWIVTR